MIIKTKYKTGQRVWFYRDYKILKVKILDYYDLSNFYKVEYANLEFVVSGKNLYPTKKQAVIECKLLNKRSK